MGGIFVAIMLGITALILLGGLVVMAIGGDVSKQWSNRLMRYRILAQAVAVLFIMGLLFFRGH